MNNLTSDKTQHLVEQDEAYWEKVNDEGRENYVVNLEKIYFSILDEFISQSNICVKRYKDMNKRYKRWRILVIILAGILAISNVFIVYNTENNLDFKFLKWLSLPLFAAVLAVFIAVVSNLESFHKYLERALAFKEMREIFLDAYRKYTLLWQTYVVPFGSTSASCINASLLYERIVERDKEIRSTVKDITKEDPDK